MDKRKPIIGVVALKDLLERLEYTEETLHVAVLEQAKLFMEASNYRVRKMRERQQAEAEWERVKAVIGLKLRRQKKSGRGGVTERHIMDLVEASQTARAAKKKYQTAAQLEEWSKLLLEAFRMRRDSLKVLASFVYVEDTMRVGHEESRKRMQREKERLRQRLPFGEEEDGS